jgi:2-polyprenyl-6-methoxyphenol hydroxylase-like FAD-dependent oxidoreductase
MSGMDSAREVLIVGSGPAGLALAIELGQRGVSCLVIERNDRVGHAPRAKTTNVRTREHLRRWGIADKLRAASPLGVDYPTNVSFITRLAGPGITRFENALYCAPGRNPLYAEHAQWVPQYTLEEVLRAHAQSLPGVEIRFNTELLSYAQDAGNGQGQVRAQLRSVTDGREYEVRSHYLVGADGARSTVRGLIGARMSGSYGLSRNYNMVFRAPGLAQAHAHGPAIMYWQLNAELPSILGPMDRDAQGDIWFFMPMQLPEGVKIAPEEAPALIARATGIAGDYEVLSSDEWTASRLIASSYRDRRVFLIGDACHLHPPFGGYGMNMGVADGVDLGWKLAAVLRGWGGAALLESYERERRPVHEAVMDEAVANHSTLGRELSQPGLDALTEEGARLRQALGARIQAAKMREFMTLGITLGYRYEDSPIIAHDGTRPPARDFINYLPSACPGSRAPHAWLHDGTSLYDHFGPGYTLLATGGATSGTTSGATQEGIAALREAAQTLRVPLSVITPPLPVLADLYQAAYVLIRPDQHVAWRGHAPPADPVTLFKTLAGHP